MDRKIWYHGRTVQSTEFDFKYTGIGNDQDGAGFYFSDNAKTAQGYAGNTGVLISAYLNYKKLVPLTGRINQKEIEFMIKNAPNYLDTLQNWGENPNQAMREAVSGFMNNDSPEDAFQYVEADFYRGYSSVYLSNMIKLKYDGHFSRSVQGDYNHFIVFNPAIIEIINTENRQIAEILREEIIKVMKK